MKYEELAKVYDRLMYDADYDKWTNFIFDRVEKGSSVLELACGTGEGTVRLCERYDVIACDISEQMLNVASEKIRKNGKKVKLICEDMTEVSIHKPVDAVVCICDGFNYITELSDLETAFKSVKNNLKSGGSFIFDISSEYKLKNMHEQMFYEDDDDITYFWNNYFDENTNCLEMNVTFFALEKNVYNRFDEQHVQRAHSINEILTLLNKTGFTVKGVFDDYSENEANSESNRITFYSTL